MTKLTIRLLSLLCVLLLAAVSCRADFLVTDEDDEPEQSAVMPTAEATVPEQPEETPEPTPAETPEPPAETPVPEPSETPVSFDGIRTVTYGSYEQDLDFSNGTEPIAWYVIREKDGYAMLLSCYALDACAYETDYGSCTWEACGLRAWLNGYFLQTAFTRSERAAMKRTHLINDNSQHFWPVSKEEPRSRDMVYLLSYREAYVTVIRDAELRQCKPTAYAQAHGAAVYDDGCCRWWLRSPGHKLYEATMVLEDGDFEYSDVNNTSYGIRPVVWVRISALEKAQER